MTDDIECPYCGKGQEINHDDGYGFGEDEIYEQECYSCEKIFTFTTYTSYSYNVSKAPCKNGDDHKYKKVVNVPGYWPDWKRCEYCSNDVKGEFVEVA